MWWMFTRQEEQLLIKHAETCDICYNYNPLMWDVAEADVL